MPFSFKNAQIVDTIEMIEKYRLDIRTVTMGISLLGCTRPTMSATCDAVYDRIVTRAARLVAVCEGIEAELGIPIVNKRISVTPISLIAAGVEGNPADIAHALNKAANEVGVNFIGGYSALVEKGTTEADRRLIESIPEALSQSEVVCGSVNIASSRAGINMDAARHMGEVIKSAAELSKDDSAIACAKLVVFANAVGDNPFMAGAFHGVEEPDCVVSVGVSGPGVVDRALGSLEGQAWIKLQKKSKKLPSKSPALVN